MAVERTASSCRPCGPWRASCSSRWPCGANMREDPPLQAHSFWPAPGRRALDRLKVKCADATQRGEYRKPIASRLGAPLRSPNSATPQLFKMVRPLPHPYSRHWLRTPRCRSDTRRVRPATATQHAQPILLPAATRSCPPAVRGLALPSLTGLPPPRRSTSPSPSCRRSSPSRGTSARCPSSRTSTTASRR